VPTFRDNLPVQSSKVKKSKKKASVFDSFTLDSCFYNVSVLAPQMLLKAGYQHFENDRPATDNDFGNEIGFINW
jgi:hypothetical protein